jgi:hypothetical protein
VGQFAGLIVLFLIVYIRMRSEGQGPELSTPASLLVFLGSIPVGLAVAAYSYQTMQDPKPPERRFPRKEWPLRAADKGLSVAIGVAWATYFLWVLFLGVVLRILRELFSLHPVSVYDIGWWCLTVSVPLALAIWAFVARRDQQKEVFETALPPELRLMVDLHRRAEAFRDRAQALEQAMEDATSISEQVRRGIELERQQLAELHEQYLRQTRLNELTPEQATAVAELFGHKQADNARRALWSNLAIGFLFYALGVLTPVLISSDALREQLRQWFPFA